MGNNPKQEDLEILAAELAAEYVKAARDGNPLLLACRELVILLAQPRPSAVTPFVSAGYVRAKPKKEVTKRKPTPPADLSDDWIKESHDASEESAHP